MTVATMPVRPCAGCGRDSRPGRNFCFRCAQRGVSVSCAADAPPPPLPLPVRSGGWREDAACAGMDLDVWFPVAECGANDREWRRTVAKAKRICSNCPVAKSCLDWALRNQVPDGIWGGQLPRERQVTAASRDQARHAALRAVEQARNIEAAPW